MVCVCVCLCVFGGEHWRTSRWSWTPPGLRGDEGDELNDEDSDGPRCGDRGEDNIERRATKQPNNSWKSFLEDNAGTIDFLFIYLSFLKKKRKENFCWICSFYQYWESPDEQYYLKQTMSENNCVFCCTVREWKLFRRINDSVITLRHLCGKFLCLLFYLTQEIRMRLWGRIQHRDRVLAKATYHLSLCI